MPALIASAVTSTSHIVVSEAGPFIPTDCSRLTGDYGGFVRMVDDEEPGRSSSNNESR